MIMKIGIKGISYSATERKYLVRIIRDSKRVYLGRFSSLEEAKQALDQEQNKQDTPEELPILSALRAEFASRKSGKKPKVSVAKPTPKPDVFVSVHNRPVKKPSKVKPKKPEVLSKVLKEESQVVTTGDWRISGPSQADYDKSVANKTLELILKRLLEMADERRTSVFDVIVQEVARLSKK